VGCNGLLLFMFCLRCGFLLMLRGHVACRSACRIAFERFGFDVFAAEWIVLNAWEGGQAMLLMAKSDRAFQSFHKYSSSTMTFLCRTLPPRPPPPKASSTLPEIFSSPTTKTSLSCTLCRPPPSSLLALNRTKRL